MAARRMVSSISAPITLSGAGHAPYLNAQVLFWGVKPGEKGRHIVDENVCPHEGGRPIEQGTVQQWGWEMPPRPQHLSEALVTEFLSAGVPDTLSGRPCT